MEQTYKDALQALSEAFNEFVKACTGKDGKGKAPEYRDLMMAKGYLPPYCSEALSKKKKKKKQEKKKDFS